MPGCCNTGLNLPGDFAQLSLTSPPNRQIRFDCKWTALGSGATNVVHAYFGNSCLAMPHLAHMSFAVVVTIIFCATCLMMVMRPRHCQLDMYADLLLPCFAAASEKPPHGHAVARKTVSGGIQACTLSPCERPYKSPPFLLPHQHCSLWGIAT